MNVLFTVLLTVSDLERAGEKYNDPKTKELIKISCYRSNSHRLLLETNNQNVDKSQV